MKRPIALAALALSLTAPALAGGGDMSAATFLDKADALRAQGPMALFSSDVGALRAEATAAGQAYGARLRTERAQGRPSSCPPKGARPSQSQWLNHLRSYPEPRRSTVTLRDAMADYYIKTWPCR